MTFVRPIISLYEFIYIYAYAYIHTSVANIYTYLHPFGSRVHAHIHLRVDTFQGGRDVFLDLSLQVALGPSQ